MSSRLLQPPQDLAPSPHGAGPCYFSDCIIAVSEKVKQDLVSTVLPRRKIVVIPLGFDLQPFLDCEKYRGEFRRN
jgi:hypothetical protein